ncbi:hypothetical protein [Novipirellula sp.]|uniref:hypothetical protein n=1 Tax=Novipirellula sp. TaxID=2795430 RepID=UPI003569E177
MVAYTGQVKFEGEGVLSRGVGNLLKKAMSGEGTSLTKVTGHGSVFCADAVKKITMFSFCVLTRYLSTDEVGGEVAVISRSRMVIKRPAVLQSRSA